MARNNRQRAAKKIQRRIDKGRAVNKRQINRIAKATGVDREKVSSINARKQSQNPTIPKNLTKPVQVRGDGSGARQKAENAAKSFDPSFQLSFDGKPYDYRNPANLNAGGRPGMGDFEINANAIDYLNPLYQFSPGQLNTAAQSIGMKNVNNPKDAKKLYQELVNPTKSR